MHTTDICSNRHRNSPESIEANKKAEQSKPHWRQQVRVFAQTTPDFTLKEVCEHFGKSLNALSGRISEMRAEKVLIPTGARRLGCAVLTLNKEEK